LPRRDREIDLELASPAQEWPHGIHDLNCRRALNGRRIRKLVVWLASSQTDHRALEQVCDVLDDVAVGHRNPKDRRARVRRSAAEKRPLTFEDPNEPMELKLFYVALCAMKPDVVSMGLMGLGG
jgi:ferric-dicitrate binding protein FerR (iron transport regulator)